MGVELPDKSKLHLGCGTRILPDYVNLDIVEHPGVDVCCDVTGGLPFPDHAFMEVLAVDFIEHVPPDKTIFLMNEAYRVLKDGGRFLVHVPEAPGLTAHQDPTHVSFWNEESFTYFLADHPRREHYGVHYGIEARFEMQSLTRKRHMWRKFFKTGNANYLWNFLLDVELVARKEL